MDMRDKNRTIEEGEEGEQEGESGGLRFLNWGKFGAALGHNVRVVVKKDARLHTDRGGVCGREQGPLT